MISLKPFLFIAIGLSAPELVVAQSPEIEMKIVLEKDSQVVRMIRSYLQGDWETTREIFPDFKKYIAPLKEIKTFSKSKNFDMKPNYLKSLQGAKSIIILCMLKPNNDVTSYKITFNSNLITSKIESIVHEPKYDLNADSPEENYQIVN